MQENLLSPTNIALFGRVFPLTVDQSSLSDALGESFGANRFLLKQLMNLGKDKKPNARFARIYAMSYEGQFYNLSRPTVFLVHGDGRDISGAGLVSRGADKGSSTDETGLAVQDFDFERSTGVKTGPGRGLKYWEYDKGDFSLRLDISSGTFEDILLEAEVDAQLQMSSAARMQTAGTARMQISHAARMQVSRRGGG